MVEAHQQHPQRPRSLSRERFFVCHQTFPKNMKDFSTILVPV